VLVTWVFLDWKHLLFHVEADLFILAKKYLLELVTRRMCETRKRPHVELSCLTIKNQVKIYDKKPWLKWGSTLWDKKKMWEKATNTSETSSFLASENVWDLIWTRVQSGDIHNEQMEGSYRLIDMVNVCGFWCFRLAPIYAMPNQRGDPLWHWLDNPSQAYPCRWWLS
jgi:hypothetical protein